MTKKEALQKIERLKQFVACLDRKPKLRHGDLVYAEPFPEDIRIVIDMRCIPDYYGKKFILLDTNGNSMNGYDDVPSEMLPDYTKIKNIFED